MARTHGKCPACGHYGSDCKCVDASDLLAALKAMQAAYCDLFRRHKQSMPGPDYIAGIALNQATLDLIAKAEGHT